MVSETCKLDFALMLAKQLGKILDRIHKKRVMHRSLSLDCVMMSQKEQGFKVTCIKDFDFAFYLHDRWMV